MEYTEIAEPPKQVVIETVTACQLKCPSCYIGSGMLTRKKGLMDWQMFYELCEQIEPFAKHVYLHLWGEPTLNPDIGKMIRHVKRFATIDLSTHGQTVTEENADDLCEATTLAVSMEGLDQEIYEKYRVGGSFEKAMNGLKILAAKRKNVNWTWVVTKDNEHQIEDARKIAEELGVNFGPKSPYFVSDSVKAQLEPSEEKFRRYDHVGELKSNRHACREFWETIYFNPEGDCTTCCFDYNASWKMGNLKENTVLEIWNGEKYRAMRRNHLAGNLNQLCATQCGLP